MDEFNSQSYLSISPSTDQIPTPHTPYSSSTSPRITSIVPPPPPLSSSQSFHISNLEPSLLANIFSYLPLPDIIRVGSVCSLFYQVASHPSLFTSLDLSSISFQISDAWLLQLLSSPRFSHLKALNINANALTDRFLSYLPQLLPFLHTLDISYCHGFTASKIVETAILLPSLQRFDFYHAIDASEVVSAVEAILFYRKALYALPPLGPTQSATLNNNINSSQDDSSTSNYIKPNNTHFLLNSPSHKQQHPSLYSDRFFQDENENRITASPDRYLAWLQKNPPSNTNTTNNHTSSNNHASSDPTAPSLLFHYSPGTDPQIPRDFIDFGKTTLWYCLLKQTCSPKNFLNSNHIVFQVNPYLIDNSTQVQSDDPEFFLNNNNVDDDDNNNIDEEQAIEELDNEPVPDWLNTFKHECCGKQMGQCFGSIKAVPVFNYQLFNNNQIGLHDPIEPHVFGNWFATFPSLPLLLPNLAQNTIPHHPQSQTPTPIPPRILNKLLLYPQAPLRTVIHTIYAECGAHRGVSSTGQHVLPCLNCDKLFLSSNIINDGWCLGCICAQNWGISINRLYYGLNPPQNRRGNRESRLQMLLPPIHTSLHSAIIRNMTPVETFRLNLDGSDDDDDNDDRNQIDDGVNAENGLNNSQTIIELVPMPSNSNIIHDTNSSTQNLSHSTAVSHHTQQSAHGQVIGEQILDHPITYVENGRVVYQSSTIHCDNDIDKDILSLFDGLELPFSPNKTKTQSSLSDSSSTQLLSSDQSAFQQSEEPRTSQQLLRQSQSTSPRRPTSFLSFYQKLKRTQDQFEHFSAVLRRLSSLGYHRAIVSTTPPCITHNHIHALCSTDGAHMIPLQGVLPPSQATLQQQQLRASEIQPSDTSQPRTVCNIHDPGIHYYQPPFLIDPQSPQSSSLSQSRHYTNPQPHLTVHDQIDPNNPTTPLDNPNNQSTLLYLYADTREVVGPTAEKQVYIHDATFRTSPLFWLVYLFVSIAAIVVYQLYLNFANQVSSDLVIGSPSSFIASEAPFDNAIVFIIIGGVTVLLFCAVIFCTIRFFQTCIRFYPFLMPVHFGLLIFSSNLSIALICLAGSRTQIDLFSFCFMISLLTVVQLFGLFHSSFLLRRVTIVFLSIASAPTFAITFPPFVIVLINLLLATLDILSMRSFPILQLDHHSRFFHNNLLIFPALSYPINSKVAVRAGEFFAIGVVMAMIYKLNFFQSILSVLFLLGSLGVSLYIAPWKGIFLSKPFIFLALLSCAFMVDSYYYYSTASSATGEIPGIFTQFMDAISSPFSESSTDYFFPQ